MTPKDPSGDPKDPLESTFAEFQKAWLSGKRPDPDEFCKSHPNCGPELRETIDSFIESVKEAPDAESDREKAPTGVSEAGDEIAGREIGDFRIIREIGCGGMGAVYEAEQISLSRRVALKVLPYHLSLSEDAVLKFKREAEAGGRQQHPGIVSIFAVGEQDGIHYIAQELVEGGYTLEDNLEKLRKEKDLPIGYFREVAQLVAELADALEHAHASGVIHRDVKPSNILLAKDGSPKVTDFGLARVEDALALSRTGDFAGTPYYMSPEQAASRRIGIDHRTDIFSLGVTLYEMLTLSRPFAGETSHEVLKKILLYDPREPRIVNPRVPRDLAVICLKAMEKKPETRYQTMVEFADDLKRFLNGEMILARPAGAMSKLMRQIKRYPALSAAVGVALVAVLAFIVYMIFSYANNRYVTERITRLSDDKVLDELIKEQENELWPAYPENIDKMNNWLADANKLVGRLPEHRKTLQNLRKKGVPTKEGTGTNSEWKFDDDILQWEHDTLAKLINDLENFKNPNIKPINDVDEGLATIKHVADRLSFARTIIKRSVDDFRKQWNRAIASIANKEKCPKYNGYTIEPQLGLIPIDQDPESGLWEFLHLKTGNEVFLERGQDGRLQLTKDTGLVFVLIPGGFFNMGAQSEYPDKDNYDPKAMKMEGPVRDVTIKPFFLSKYEMTQAQWERFTGNNPSLFKPEEIRYGVKEPKPLNPVEYVSWRDCEDTLSRLGLRLPTESEWEYAARAEKTTVWWTGNDKNSLASDKKETCAANINDRSHKDRGWMSFWPCEEWDDGYPGAAPVTYGRPNPFGLHNIYGNVWEWCQDKMHGNYKGAPKNGEAWEEEGGSRRVCRGGSWFFRSFSCRSSVRHFFTEVFLNPYTGVRPAKSISKDN